MELTFEQIASAANGVVRIEQNDLGLELHRFTRDQEAFFYKTHPLFCRESFFNGYFGRNCRTCSGITLDFLSDADEIVVEFGKIEYQNDAQVQLFDLYTDNKFVKSYPADGNIIYKSSGKKQRFALYFPTYNFPVISSIDLKDATIFLPYKKPVDVLFLGDSITQGCNAVHPSNTYVMRVAKNLGIGIINQASSGFVYDEGSIEKVCEPKLVITAYGINDFWRKDIEQLEYQTVTFLKKIRSVYTSSKILSILPLWTTFEGEESRSLKRECLRAIYEKYSDYMVDGYDLMPHDIKYFADGMVHPNDEGFEIYGDCLTTELVKIFHSVRENTKNR